MVFYEVECEASLFFCVPFELDDMYMAKNISNMKYLSWLMISLHSGPISFLCFCYYLTRTLKQNSTISSSKYLRPASVSFFERWSCHLFQRWQKRVFFSSLLLSKQSHFFIFFLFEIDSFLYLQVYFPKNYSNILGAQYFFVISKSILSEVHYYLLIYTLKIPSLKIQASLEYCESLFSRL